MTLFFISLATPEDVEAIRNIQREVWLATYPNDEYGITIKAIQALFADKEKSSQWINQVKKALIAGESIGWIAKLDNKIIGYCFVQKTNSKNRILSLYVLPVFQKQGIGKALMEKILKWVDATKPTVLEVAIYNTNAIKFYTSFGFRENGPTQNDAAALQMGIVIPEIKMLRI